MDLVIPNYGSLSSHAFYVPMWYLLLSYIRGEWGKGHSMQKKKASREAHRLRSIGWMSLAIGIIFGFSLSSRCSNCNTFYYLWKIRCLYSLLLSWKRYNPLDRSQDLVKIKNSHTTRCLVSKKTKPKFKKASHLYLRLFSWLNARVGFSFLNNQWLVSKSLNFIMYNAN